MNNILLINKEQGYTSQDVVSKVKKILNIKKAGHTGTLDPMATGVLPILLNDATKLSKYLIEHDKTYIATLKLGEKRDTGDEEGSVIYKKEVNAEIFSKEKDIYINIERALNSFLGETNQIPPIYSAIKVNGRKLYEYARDGEYVEIPERKITIYKINLIEVDEKNEEIIFEVSCSKGTYIRKLCEDIAEVLKTVGYMKRLSRTQVDKFFLENTITLTDLEKIKNEKNIEELLLTKECMLVPEKIFEYEKEIYLNVRKKELFLNGVKLTFDLEDGIYKIYSNNIFLGIGIVKDKLLKRDIIFNN